MTTTWALLISLLLLVGNAFFVAAEFALVASKRHRLQEAADNGSRAAVAAVAGSRELSLMLAGAQLGITLCTLGLGALAKPAVADLLTPVLSATGLPDGTAYVIAFVLALSLVVFLHMVIGEMAPKSWAISHPENSALLLALPFRAFARASRLALRALNAMANGILRLIKVEPQDELAHAHGPAELRMLIEASKEHGTLPADEHRLLLRMLRLQDTLVWEVMVGHDDIVSIGPDATATDAEQVSEASGRSRLPVLDDGRVLGVVHIREVLIATTAGRPATPVTGLMTPAYQLAANSTIIDAVAAMRANRAQVALVTDPAGALVGLAALEDLIEEIIGEFDDETDPATPHPAHA